MTQHDPTTRFWRFESQELFLSLSGSRRRLGDRAPWPLVALAVLACVALGLLDRHIPNPMLPGAFIALAMVVPVVVGALWGVRAGALVGLAGTAGSLAVQMFLFGFNPFEACGLRSKSSATLSTTG